MSPNEEAKRKAAALLRDGVVFALGLSERAHGADIYATEMALTPQPDGAYRANGEKYYIGNGNMAPIVSTFGKIAGRMTTSSSPRLRHRSYELIRNITDSQSSSPTSR